MISQIIIYGAGKRGRKYYEFLKEKKLSDYVYGFCDRNYEQLDFIDDKKVYSYEAIKSLHYPFLLSVTAKLKPEISNKLKSDGNTICSIDALADLAGENRVEFNRDFCAFYHVDGMDEYFDEAETDELLSVFWSDCSEFKKMFNTLDLSDVIELACGRGRHVPRYIEESKAVTLVDILQQNIDYCRKRFKAYENISYYCNNGYNLEKLDSNRYTSIFCYDAMVHFEMMDIYEYLKDMYRVLAPAGRVLIHHSNQTSDYKASFANAFAGRNFMSRELFAYLSYRAGFEVIAQKDIDWNGVKALDCITLLEKPVYEADTEK